MVLTEEAPVPRVVLPEEVRVVKAPVLGVVEPMVPGEAQVPPNKVEALMVPVPVKSREAPEPTTMVAVVLVPEVIFEKDEPPLPLFSQVGVTPGPAEVRICPAVPAFPPGIRAPENWTLPALETVNLALPEDEATNKSLPLF